MTPEEFKRIKEAEKAHLRKLKELKSAVRRLDRQKKVNSALESMLNERQSTLDTHAELVERLARETAEQEARLDVALEATGETTPAPPEPAASDEELEKLRAQALVRQMKAQLGTPDAERTDAPKTIGRAAPDADADAPKTIGRAAPKAPEDDAPGEPPRTLPDKTLGRPR